MPLTAQSSAIASSRSAGRRGASGRARRATASRQRDRASSAWAATGRPAGSSASSAVAQRLRRSADRRARLSRPKMASALARDTCCETMMETRLAKPGSDRRSGTSPATARTATSRGSAAQSASSPRSMSSSVSMRLHGGPCRRAGRHSSNRAAMPAPIRFRAPTDDTRLPLRAEPERRAASRPCAVGADSTSGWRGAWTAACCCASRTSTRRAARRNSRRQSCATSPGSACAGKSRCGASRSISTDYRDALSRG